MDLRSQGKSPLFPYSGSKMRQVSLPFPSVQWVLFPYVEVLLGSSFELNTGVFVCHLPPSPGQPAEQDPNSGSPGHRGDSWGGILSQNFFLPGFLLSYPLTSLDPFLLC